jgi:omega-6 fatty acid desaturase (delta-12 desaturase)
MHHNSAGNLDKRGVGDIWTLTLSEYLASSRGKRFWYRVYRNPIVLFVILPPLLFFIIQRLPHKGVGRREVASVLIANAGIIVMQGLLVLAFGWESLLLVQLPMFGVSSILGIWLFYIQHQFDPGYWEHEEEWEHLDAALQGSSHYKLPKVLQWISGNIGLHHIHHCRPRIPNYNLQACYDATPELQLADPLTLWTSLRSINMNLWDETGKTLMSFSQAHAVRRKKLKEIATEMLQEKLGRTKMKRPLPSA